MKILVYLLYTSFSFNKSGSPLTCFHYVLCGHAKPYVYGLHLHLHVV